MGPGGEEGMLAGAAWKSLKFHKDRTEHLSPHLPQSPSQERRTILFWLKI